MFVFCDINTMQDLSSYCEPALKACPASVEIFPSVTLLHCTVNAYNYHTLAKFCYYILHFGYIYYSFWIE